MECNRDRECSGVVASAGVCDAFCVLACRARRRRRPSGRVATPAPAPPAKPAALDSGRRSRFACACGQALARKRRMDHRPDGAGTGAFARRGQSHHAAIQVRSAHSDRRARERVPAAEWRAQRGAHRARCRGGDQPGPARAVARSRARDHQEEQACRAAGVRSGAAAACRR